MTHTIILTKISMQDSYMIKTDLGMVMYVPYMLKQMLGHLFLKGHEKPGVYFKKGIFFRRVFISYFCPTTTVKYNLFDRL